LLRRPIGELMVKLPVWGDPSKSTHWVRVKKPKPTVSIDPIYAGFTTWVLYMCMVYCGSCCALAYLDIPKREIKIHSPEHLAIRKVDMFDFLFINLDLYISIQYIFLFQGYRHQIQLHRSTFPLEVFDSW